MCCAPRVKSAHVVFGRRVQESVAPSRTVKYLQHWDSRDSSVPLTWNSHWKVSPTSGQPMEPSGSGSSHLLSRVRLQRRLHSCRVSASSSSSDSSDVSAVASADSSPSIVPPSFPVHLPASTTCVRLRLQTPRSAVLLVNEAEFCSVRGEEAQLEWMEKCLRSALRRQPIREPLEAVITAGEGRIMTVIRPSQRFCERRVKVLQTRSKLLQVSSRSWRLRDRSSYCRLWTT